MAGSWGGGDYNESGGSELVYRDGQLLGGLTAGPSGEPTIDIHDVRGRAADAPRDVTRSDEMSRGDERDEPGTARVEADPPPRRALPRGDESAGGSARRSG